MILKYKAFGLGLLAMFAFGAIASQSALANPLTVSGVVSGQKVFITGTTDKESSIHTLTVQAGLAVECTHALYRGSAVVVSGAVNEITLTPEYTGCKAFDFATAHVKHNGCTYTLTTPTKLKEGEVTWGKEQTHVVCPEGKKIEITPTSFGISVCTGFVGSQTPATGHVVARNAGTGAEMTLTDEVTVEGIAYTSTNPACGQNTNNAKFTGNTSLACYSNEAHTIKASCTFS